MSGNHIEKIIAKMKRSSYSIRFTELAKVLEAHGYEIRSHKKGSHRYFTKEGQMPLSIPEKNPVRYCYVKQVLELIEKE